MALWNGGLPPVRARMKWETDGEGLGARVRLATDPGATMAVLRIFDRNHAPQPGRGPYADATGTFAQLAPVEGSLVRFYLPYAAVGHALAGRYTLVATFSRSDGSVCGGTGFEDLALPAPRPYSAVAMLAPLVGLVMAVIRADGVVGAEEVRRARIRLTSRFDLGDADLPVLRDLMKAPVPTDLAAQVRKLFLRFPRAIDRVAAFLVDIAIDVARADGRARPAEEAVIRQIVAALHSGETFQAAWADVAHRLRSPPAEHLRHLALLELPEDADTGQIKAAYRAKVKAYHPDRFATNPPEFRELATRKTIELNQAWAALRPTVDAERPPKPRWHRPGFSAASDSR